LMVVHASILVTVKSPFLMGMIVGLFFSVLVLGLVRGVLVPRRLVDCSVRKAHGNQSESDSKIRPMVGQWLRESTSAYYDGAVRQRRRRRGF